MATRGTNIKSRRATSAVQRAISTSSSAVGSMLTLVSARKYKSPLRVTAVAARNFVQALAHAHNLQRRANGIRKVLGHPCDQYVGVSHMQHHRTENIRIVDEHARLSERDSPALPQRNNSWI